MAAIAAVALRRGAIFESRVEEAKSAGKHSKADPHQVNTKIQQNTQRQNVAAEMGRKCSGVRTTAPKYTTRRTHMFFLVTKSASC